MGDFAQRPDRVCSLYSIIGDNNRGLAAAEDDLQGGVGRVLYTAAFKYACETHTNTQRLNTDIKHREEMENMTECVCVSLVGLHTTGAISSRGCSMLNTVGKDSL